MADNEISDHAKMAEASYAMNTSKNKAERLADAQAKAPEGYQIHDKSTSNVSLFLNPENKTAVIAHRGTALGEKSRNTDVASDLLYGMGLQTHSKQLSKRTRESENLLKHVPDDYKLNMTGHSLGGASMLHTLEKSHKVRDRVDKAHGFNALLNPFESKVHRKKHESKKDAEAKLNDQITIHRVRGDIASMREHQYGDVKTHKAKARPPKRVPKHFKDVFNTVNQLATHSIKNWT